MTIRKRLILSHGAMLLIPILLFFLLFGILEALFTGQPSVSRAGVNNPMVVSRIMEDYVTVQKDGSPSERAGAETHMLELLGQLGYRVSIQKDDTPVYSSLIDADNAVLRQLPQELDKTINISVQTETNTLIAQNTVLYGETILIQAVRDAQPGEETSFDSMRYTGLLSVGLAVLIVIITNGTISTLTANRLLKPIRALGRGARSIRDGDLDTPLSYEGKDEFAQVFHSFEEMRVRLKESIRRQLDMLEDRKELVAGISHDLRTPLTAIKGYMEGILDGVANTPEKQGHYLETIYKKTGDMEALVDQLFLFSKLDTGRVPLDLTQTDITVFLKGLIDEVGADYAKTGLHIRLDDGADAVWADIDRGQFRRVISNILDNSRKYRDRPHGHVEISAGSIGGYAHIALRDDGPGVPSESLEKLFTAFFRNDPSRTHPSEGSGLGLAISRAIVEAHSGTITADNDNGLRIVIKLPLREEA